MNNKKKLLDSIDNKIGWNLQSAVDSTNSGLNNLRNNAMIKKARAASSITKMGALTAGVEGFEKIGLGDQHADILEAAGASMLGINAFGKGSETSKALSEAAKRKEVSTQKEGDNGSKNNAASAANSFKNSGSFLKNQFLMNQIGAPSLLGDGVGSVGFGMGPNGMGMLASKGFDKGITGLGDSASGGLESLINKSGSKLGDDGFTDLSMLGGMPGGMAAMMAVSKLGKMGFDKIQEGSSLNKNKLSDRQTRTKGTQPHQLESDYGSTTLLNMQLMRLQSQNQVDPGTALMITALNMIEGHTSVLPMIASETVDQESRKTKEGAGSAQNKLHDLFGDDGISSKYDQMSGGRERTITEKILQGIEMGSAEMVSTFDLTSQFSNLMSGISSTKVANETRDNINSGVQTSAEKEFGLTFGISSSNVQVLHTSPAQLLMGSNNAEDAQIRLLGGIFQASQMNAQELLTIRTNGFGITSGTSYGHLKDLIDQKEMEKLGEKSSGIYEQWVRPMDELLGYIPGWNMLSGTAKMVNRTTKGAQDYFIDKETDRKDYDSDEEYDQAVENNKSGYKKSRNIKEVFTDWMESGLENDVFNSEESLRKAIGAEVMTDEKKMYTYLGGDYPDRFELLLKYNHHQMQSLESLVGDIDRTETEDLTINKYTGKLGDDQYHDEEDAKIRSNLDFEKSKIGFKDGWMGEIYQSLNNESMVDHMWDKAKGKNNGIEEFLNENNEVYDSLEASNLKTKKKEKINVLSSIGGIDTSKRQITNYEDSDKPIIKKIKETMVDMSDVIETNVEDNNVIETTVEDNNVKGTSREVRDEKDSINKTINMEDILDAVLLDDKGDVQKTKELSVQDQQDDELEETRIKRKLNLQEKQLLVLEEIRDNTSGAYGKKGKKGRSLIEPDNDGDTNILAPGGFGFGRKDKKGLSNKTNKTNKTKGVISTIKEFFKGGALGKLMKKGGESAVFRVLAPVLGLLSGPALGIVLGAVSTASIAYMIYDGVEQFIYGDDAQEQEEAKLLKTSKFKDIDDVEKVLDKMNHQIDGANRASRELKAQIKKASTSDLNMLLLQISERNGYTWYKDNDRVLKSLIEEELLTRKDQGKKLTTRVREEIFGQKWDGSFSTEIDYNSFDILGGKEEISKLGTKDLQSLLKEDSLKGDMRKYIEKLLKYKSIISNEDYSSNNIIQKNKQLTIDKGIDNIKIKEKQEIQQAALEKYKREEKRKNDNEAKKLKNDNESLISNMKDAMSDGSVNKEDFEKFIKAFNQYGNSNNKGMMEMMQKMLYINNNSNEQMIASIKEISKSNNKNINTFSKELQNMTNDFLVKQ